MEAKDFRDKNFTDEELVKASTETFGSAPSQKSLWAQAELMRKLMESIRNFDKSTSRYSTAIIALTFVLFLIGLLQLAVTILGPFEGNLAKITVFIAAAIL